MTFVTVAYGERSGLYVSARSGCRIRKTRLDAMTGDLEGARAEAAAMYPGALVVMLMLGERIPEAQR